MIISRWFLRRMRNISDKIYRETQNWHFMLNRNWTDFHEIWYLRIFRKSVEKINVSLKPDKNYGYFTWRPMYIYDNFPLISSKNEKYFRQNLYRNSKHAFYAQSSRLWDNAEKYGTARRTTDHNKIRRMRFAYLIANAIETHSENEIVIDFPQQKWSRERTSILCLYVQYMSWCIL